jgi:serine/threonine-protein kinase HipA
MPFCPITLTPVPEGTTYSLAGLRMLNPKLTKLEPIDLTYEEQIRQARLRADKMSVQGVQPKLSALLKVTAGCFEVVDRGGKFLLKPNPISFSEVPANESVTMSMAAAAGIDVPVHGLVPAIDDSWVYFIRRFDRTGHSKKLHVEDFSQLSGASRESKYESSLEKVAKLVEEHCTFPALEKPKLAKRLLFCFLTGNEDMHLKNFSLLVANGTVSLSPAYDLLNTTLVLDNAIEESALPLKGKQQELTRNDWLKYFCKECLALSNTITEKLLADLQGAIPEWQRLLSHCHLSETRKLAYLELLNERAGRIGLK